MVVQPKDIHWFVELLQEFNGTVDFHKKFEFTENIYVDACLTGVGAKYHDFVYSCKIPEFVKLVGSIVHFEAVNVLPYVYGENILRIKVL